MSALAALKRRFLDPEPPTIAVEVRPRGLGLVRLHEDRGRVRFEAAAAMDLPEGAVTVSMTHPNITDAAAFSIALRGAMERAGVLGGARVALVIPDPAVRVALWPVSEVAGKSAQEADDLIRFKLRKTVPFEVRDARIDWLSEPGAELAVVTAIHRPVLRSYEEACLSAGLQPGVVQPCGLALLGGAVLDATAGDRLLVNWEDGYLTLLLARAGRLALARTLVGEAVTSAAAVAREVANTGMYYQERLGGAGLSAVLVRSTAVPIDEALLAIGASCGSSAVRVDPWAALGATDVGPASQTLAGAAASLAWAHA